MEMVKQTRLVNLADPDSSDFAMSEFTSDSIHDSLTRTLPQTIIVLGPGRLNEDPNLKHGLLLKWLETW